MTITMTITITMSSVITTMTQKYMYADEITVS